MGSPTRRTALSGLVSVTAMLLSLGLAAPAIAEPSPEPDQVTSVETEPVQTPPAEAVPTQQASPEPTTPADDPSTAQTGTPTSEPSGEITPAQAMEVDAPDDASFAPIEEFATANPWIGTATGDPVEISGGGMEQTFTNATVYWSSATGAHSVHGGIGGVFTAHGGHEGPLGLPTSEEYAVTGGVQQDYQGGSVLWSSSTGAHPVWGAIGTLWVNQGGPDYLGLPTSDEITLGTRQVIQHFQRGSIFWNNGRIYSIAGAIGSVWQRMGGLNSPLGLPTTAEINLGTRKVAQYFQRGMIIWNNSRTHAVSGGIGDYWTRNGGLTGRYGAPISGEISLGTRKVVQNFEGGSIGWDNGRIFTVSGGIGSYWTRNGGATGRFGAPTSGEICNNAGCYQNFQRGSITWGRTTGAHDMYKLDRRCTYGRAVCADKTTNKMYWVVNGKIQGTWDARFGAKGWETTNGEMRIIRKVVNDWSVPFSAWMPYSQYFTSSGMAIHYSSSFEQQGFPSWGSHGCINMNDYNGARWLYNQTRLGDRVVVYYS